MGSDKQDTERRERPDRREKDDPTYPGPERRVGPRRSEPKPAD